MSDGMSNVKHVVVLMLENRSFDNMTGYVYADQDNKAPHVIPGGSSPKYDGLAFFPPRDPNNPFWNPTDEGFYSGKPSGRIYASREAGNFTMPDPDPEEHFADMTYQIFGPQPAQQDTPNQMKGFYLNYEKATTTPGQIMQCYSTAQVGVITALAQNYAISDEWFASSPTQTWPNRAFVHLGTSCGRVNNFPYDPYDYDVKTIFNTLDEMNVSWAVYNDSELESLTRLQLPKLWHLDLDKHFLGFEQFQEDAQRGTLPAYSFLEPSFLFEPNDEHPPHDVALGEKFLWDTWQAVSTGKNWTETLLVITYDEHGGCYDHVPPRFGATTPDAASDPGEDGFYFNRFGVRVATILVSPFIEPQTVFRTTKIPPKYKYTPYDHTSVLATLRDWKGIPADKMPPSHRTAQAPTFGNVLTRSSPREILPVIPPPNLDNVVHVSPDAPVSEFQFSIVAAALQREAGSRLSSPELAKLRTDINTRQDAMDFMANRTRP